MLWRKLKYHNGDLVIFRMTKHSTCPGPRARGVEPAPLGEDYVYHVDKHWVVVDALENNRVLLRTRRGKEHMVDASNPNLRLANWWERLFYRNRFPRLEAP